MPIEDWSKTVDGQIKTAPLVGYETARFYTAGLIRLQFVTSEHQLQTGDYASLQLVASPNPLRDLARCLLSLADEIDRAPKGSQQ